MNLDFSPSSLAAGFIFGTFGFYFIKRGKACSDLVWVGIGVVLMIYPYFIENPFLLWGIGIALLGLGYRLR
jgi:hypothetical protein